MGVQVPLSAPFSITYAHPLIGCRTSISVTDAETETTLMPVFNQLAAFTERSALVLCRFCDQFTEAFYLIRDPCAFLVTNLIQQ